MFGDHCSRESRHARRNEKVEDADNNRQDCYDANSILLHVWLDKGAHGIDLYYLQPQ